jgi:hypothetical protein
MPNPKRMSIACGTHSLVGRLSVSSDRLFRHLVPTQSLRDLKDLRRLSIAEDLKLCSRYMRVVTDVTKD